MSAGTRQASRLQFVFVVLMACAAYAADSPVTPSWTDERLYYSFSVPDDWIQVPGNAVLEMARQSTEISGTSPQSYETAFQKRSSQYFTFPYLLVQHHDLKAATLRQIAQSMGSVADRDGLNELRSLESFKQMEFGMPFVDSERNAVITRMTNTYPRVGSVTALSVAFPGRDGTVGIYLYSQSSDFDRHLPVFEKILDSFSFAPGHGYSPARAMNDGISEGARNTLIGAMIGGLIGMIITVIRRRLSKPPNGNSPEE